jgi:hypothetical protein
MSLGAHFLDALDSDGRVRPHRLRDVAVSLAAYATDNGKGRGIGDAVHELVTEGRTKANIERRSKGSPEVPYSSCGDLPHWMLAALGCTDERLVNRSDDGGQTPWKVGANISRIVNAPGFVRAGGGREPQPGDVLFIMNAHGGHVCVLQIWAPSADLAVTDDYGQPTAKRRKRTLLPGKHGGWTLDGDPLVGWLDLERVPLHGPARLPEAVAEAL